MATPIEIKAEEKAKELIDSTYMDLYSPAICNRCFDCDNNPCNLKLKQSIKSNTKLCDQIIEILNTIKGMGKIHKVKFWKLVKENIENYNG